MTQENKPKILLVDDDRFLLDIYALKFKASGYEIDTSSNSKETMEKLRTGSKYDIIILDIIMPGIDGIEMLKAIKQEKLSEGATVIMLTNQAEEVEKAKLLGVDGYIVKATTIPSEVVETVLKIHNNKHKK